MADETHRLQKDPAEGSRETVEHELERQRSGQRKSDGKPEHQKPDELSDRTQHKQQRLFESENRANRSAPIEGPEAAERKGERTLGDAAGPDTSRGVAHPAELNRPGASSKLGGTPGANATRSTGRQTD